MHSPICMNCNFCSEYLPGWGCCVVAADTFASAAVHRHSPIHIGIFFFSSILSHHIFLSFFFYLQLRTRTFTRNHINIYCLRPYVAEMSTMSPVVVYQFDKQSTSVCQISAANNTIINYRELEWICLYLFPFCISGVLLCI